MCKADFVAHCDGIGFDAEILVQPQNFISTGLCIRIILVSILLRQKTLLRIKI